MNLKYIFRILVLSLLPHLLYLLVFKLFNIITASQWGIPYAFENVSLTLLFTILFFINETILYKATKNYFTRYLFFIPIIIFIAIITSGFIYEDIICGERCGGELGNLLLWGQVLGVAIGAAVFSIIRVILQNVFLSFYQKLPYLALEKYFSKIIYLMLIGGVGFYFFVMIVISLNK